MLSSKTYRTLALLGAFLVVAVQSISAMSCPTHMSKVAEPMQMACCNGSASQMTPVCPMPHSMTSSCSCQVTPASETSRKAVVTAPVPVMEVTVTEVFAGQIPETPESEYISEDPPDLHPDVPIFLQLRTLLN